MKSSARSGFASLVALLVTSCATMTKEDVEIVNRAKTIHRYPVSRDKFIKTLGLEKISSERIGGGIRSGRCLHLETWTLQSGKEIRAWDSYYVGNVPINRASIDTLLNRGWKYDAYLDRGPTQPPFDIRLPISAEPPRKSFEACVIASPRGKVFFSSTDFPDATNKSR